MNKTNPIFEALNELPENYAAEAVTSGKKKMKKPLKIALIAVAAATLALMVGFTTEAVRSGDHKFNFGVGNSANHSFYFNLTSQEFTIPDEITEKFEYGIYREELETPPSELFRKFKITPLITDNYTDTDEKTLVEIYDNGSFQTILFEYTLYNENLREKIWFKAEYISDIENYQSEGTYHFNEGDNPQTVTLNDGSLCLVTKNMAVFAYNGVRIVLVFDDPNPQYGVETVKQALTDLGIYDHNG